MDWLDLLAVQGTLKSLLQYHSSTASNLQHSAFFMVQLPHSYMTTAKSTALTVRTFVSKMLSLLSNMLSRFIIAFLPRSKRLLISRLQSPPAMILEPKKITSITANFSHIHEYAAFSHTQTQKRELSFTSSFFLFFFFFEC